MYGLAGSSHNRLGRSRRHSLNLFLFAFGLLLNVMKIPAHGLFTDMLGAHGLLFGFLLPLAVYSLIPTILIWFIAWVVVAFYKNGASTGAAAEQETIELVR